MSAGGSAIGTSGLVIITQILSKNCLQTILHLLCYNLGGKEGGWDFIFWCEPETYSASSGF